MFKKTTLLVTTTSLMILTGCQNKTISKPSLIDYKKINTDFKQIQEKYNKEAPDYQISEINLETERVDKNRTAVYEIEGFKDKDAMDVTLKANNLAKVRHKQDQPDMNEQAINFDKIKLPIDKAIEKAQTYANVKSNPEELSLKVNKKGTLTYEVKFEEKHQEIEVSINAETGDKISIDYDD